MLAPAPSFSITASSTTMARVAPTGSMKMPSQRRMPFTGSRTRANRTSGSTTVGPETTRIAAEEDGGVAVEADEEVRGDGRR